MGLRCPFRQQRISAWYACPARIRFRRYEPEPNLTNSENCDQSTSSSAKRSSRNFSGTRLVYRSISVKKLSSVIRKLPFHSRGIALTLRTSTVGWLQTIQLRSSFNKKIKRGGSARQGSILEPGLARVQGSHHTFGCGVTRYYGLTWGKHRAKTLSLQAWFADVQMVGGAHPTRSAPPPTGRCPG